MTERSNSKISLTWALLCMAVSLIAAIAANETLLPGRGKAVFLGVFVTAFVAKSIAREANRHIVIPFLGAIVLIHLLLVALAPRDDLYPGGLLFPIGILDIGLCYLAFRWLQKNVAPTR